jgi:hypothetical protein
MGIADKITKHLNEERKWLGKPTAEEHNIQVKITDWTKSEKPGYAVQVMIDKKPIPAKDEGKNFCEDMSEARERVDEILSVIEEMGKE